MPRSHSVSITLGDGGRLSVHRRDIAKDAVIMAMLPEAPRNIFEASAGRAQLAQRLRDKGYELAVSNYDLEENLPIPQIKLDLNARNGRLPGAPFDAVICREVIEHVESVPHVLRFFREQLADDGVLILSFPNRLTFRSRLYHLLTGFYRGMPSPINLSHYLGLEHINLIGYPEMDYFLRKTGYAVEEVRTSEIAPLDHLCLTAWPFIWLATTYFLLFHKKRREGHEKDSPPEIRKNRFIRDRLLSRALFLGKDVIIKARRLPDGSADSGVPPHC